MALRRSVARRAGKDLKFGVEARQSMLKGVENIVAAVATTLGPKGRNVVLEQAYGGPKITKDGVTVAKAIEFKDPFENLGAQLVRQVCNKTNDIAGDGTTTSAVLVNAIFSEGFKSIATGTNPIDMKRGIDKAVAAIQDSITTQTRQVASSKDIEQVATISANGDIELGKMIADAMERVGKDGVITTQDGKTMNTEVEVVEGMRIDRGYLSPYFVTDAKASKVEYENATVLISSQKVSSIQSLLPALNAAMQAQRPLLIIADDVDGEALTTLVVNKLQGRLKVACVKAPGFGDNKTNTLQDIAIFTGAQVIGDENTGVKLSADNFDPSWFGSMKKVTMTKDETIFLGGGGDAEAVKERADFLRHQINEETSDYNREKLEERLAKLAGGVAVIRVGAASEVELGEKKDRIQDALCATRAAVQEGIIAGGGTALLVASKSLDALLNDASLNNDQKTGVRIVRDAVRQPAMKIAANAGKEGAVVVEKILEATEAGFGYDARNDKYTNMFDAGIIDPTRVVRISITDSASVAGLMMTTEAAVCDFPKEEAAAPAGGMGGGMGGMGGMM